MNRSIRVGGSILLVVAIYLVSAAECTSLWALQRPLRARAHNYETSPVAARKLKVELVETFVTPTQGSTNDPTVRRSRVRYANRAGQLASHYELQGEVLCQNVTQQTVEAFALTIVALDAFHQPLSPPGRVERYASQQVVETLPRRSSKRITWQVPVKSSDVYEVSVIVTQVRFSDGSVWLAPREALTDIF